MSEWITDRLPTEADSDIMGKVWIFEDNDVYWSDYSVVTDGTPWMPIKQPAPYVKPEPKRWKPQDGKRYYYVTTRGEPSWGIYKQYYDGSDGSYTYEMYLSDMYENGNCFQTRAQAIEAARRVRKTLLNYHKELNNE